MRGPERFTTKSVVCRPRSVPLPRRGFVATETGREAMAEEMMLLRAFPGIDHAAVGVIISNSTLLRVDGIGEAVVVEVGIIRRSSQRNLRFQHLDRPGPVEMTKPAAAVRQVCGGGGYTARDMFCYGEIPASVAPRRVEGNMNDRVWGPTSRRHRCWEEVASSQSVG